MRYEKPIMDIIKLEEYDVVTLSVGTGDVTDSNGEGF